MEADMLEMSSMHLRDKRADSMDEKPYLDLETSEHDISTDFAKMHVVIEGNTKKPAILTFHDIGMNSSTNFKSFFRHPQLSMFLKHFCIYHLNAPGQEENADLLSDSCPYPSLDDISAMIGTVLDHFKRRRFIGFGVGAGANILARFACNFPDVVDALVLVNCSSTKAGWIEWGFQKLSNYYLHGKGMTTFSQDYLLWHHFGNNLPDNNQSDDLVSIYKEHLCEMMPRNLAMFAESYMNRSDLGITRDSNVRGKLKGINCPVLLVCSNGSPHVRDVETTFSRISADRANLLKVSDCGGMVLHEQPGKVAEAMKLFLQGQGYLLNTFQVGPNPVHKNYN